MSLWSIVWVWPLCCFFFFSFLAHPVLAAEAPESDADQDGLFDHVEERLGTSLVNADTDGDGFSDGEELRAAYSPTSTKPVRLSKSILINLTTSRLEQRVANVPIASFPISAGLPGAPTPVGHFTISSKHPRAWSNLASLWMPYWMNFSGPRARQGLYGIHELPEWSGGRKEGANSLGKPASRGCVRLGIGPAKILYDWAPIGTQVVVIK